MRHRNIILIKLKLCKAEEWPKLKFNLQFILNNYWWSLISFFNHWAAGWKSIRFQSEEFLSEGFVLFHHRQNRYIWPGPLLLIILSFFIDFKWWHEKWWNLMLSLIGSRCNFYISMPSFYYKSITVNNLYG